MKVRWKCGRRNLIRRRDWKVNISDEVPPPWRQRMRGSWLSSVLMIEAGRPAPDVFLCVAYWGG